jgi:DNA processing protein
MPTEIESAIILQSLPGLGPSGSNKLREQCGSFQQILDTPIRDLAPPHRAPLQQFHAESEYYLANARKTVSICSADGITIVTVDSKDYPVLLKEIASPPPVLYIKGNANLLNLPQIAIVGSRQHTAAGESNARAFAQALSDSGFIITSGMALGIDAAAHCGAIKNGSTIAVLGTGIDVIYPRRHGDLYRRICSEGGVLISEFPLGTPARPGNFPQRNRIISGLSLGVLVVEAALPSGSLITARAAMNQGREVFAIPGSIHNPVSRGCHQLIREGATLVETARDIVSELSGMLSFMAETPNPQRDSYKELDSGDSNVLEALGFDAVDMDTLINRANLSAAVLTAALMRLELRGLVENRNGRFCRIH